MAEPSRRVTVTHPRTRAAHAGSRHGAARDVREQTALGEVYVRSLMRSQLKLALAVCGVVFLPLACLPVLFAYVPTLRRPAVWGVPLPWLVLGLPVYTVLVAAAVFHVRRAERIERDFAEHVRRS